MPEQLSLFADALLCNGPAHEAQKRANDCFRNAGVVQRRGPFTFYATFDSDSLCSYIPAETSILLPASSWSRKSLSKPRVPAHITDTAADSGGFVASRIWGEYRYTLAQYVAWLKLWRPRWAATMDYCCEPELSVVTRERQRKTTENALAAWSSFRDESWAWCPTVQGWTPDEYRRHASELKPLIDDMQAHYERLNNPYFRVGVGTLCHRNDVRTVQAIVDAVRAVIPAIPLHLWGIKLDALRSVNLAHVVSTDSAVWHGAMYARDEQQAAAAERGMSVRRYRVLVNLPAYVARVQAAVNESRSVQAAQSDTLLLVQARAALKRYGWTLHLRDRRNRTYAYASKRNGQVIESRYIGSLSELEAMMSGSDWSETLHNALSRK